MLVSTQFYLNEGCVGAPRDASCAAKIAELNQYVTVRIAPAPLPATPAFVAQFTVSLAVVDMEPLTAFALVCSEPSKVRCSGMLVWPVRWCV